MFLFGLFLFLIFFRIFVNFFVSLFIVREDWKFGFFVVLFNIVWLFMIEEGIFEDLIWVYCLFLELLWFDFFKRLGVERIEFFVLMFLLLYVLFVFVFKGVFV